MSFSLAEDPRYHKFERKLSKGWVPGRKVDNTDLQYKNFRRNLPYMILLLIFHPILRRVWDTFNDKTDKRKSLSANRLEQRASFDYAFAILFLFILHGVSGFKVLAILSINYQITRKVPRQYIPAATWAFNICTLFGNEIGKGYPLVNFARYLSPPGASGAPSELMRWGKWIDSYGGIIARWEVLFNITVLRLISFNMDYYWSIDKRVVNATEVRK